MDTLFVVASKTAWLLNRPETLLVALIAMALVVLRLERTVAASRSLVVARTITIVIDGFLIGHFLRNPLVRAYPNHQVSA